MPEGVAVAGGRVIGEPTFDNPKMKPEPDASSPLGYTWDRTQRRWRPKKGTGRGGKPQPENSQKPQPEPAGPADSGTSDRDPDPRWFSDDDKKPGDDKKGQTIRDIPEKVVNDIAGFIGLMGAPVMGLIAQVDPYCGGALAANFEPIVDAALPLVCRSTTITRWFSGDKSTWLEWVGLAVALRPVATAVYEHHVKRSVEIVRDQYGIAHVVPRSADGSEHGDHLTPPVPDYAQYAA